MTTLRKHLRRLYFVAFTAAAMLQCASRAQAQVKAYPVAPTSADAVLKQLNQRYPDASGVHITYDPRTSQILVVAPPELQQKVAEILQPPGTGETPIQAAGPAPAGSGAKEATGQNAGARGPKVVALHHLTGREFESTLSGALGRVLPVTEEHGGEWARYTLESRGGSVAIVVDRKANQVALEGPVRLADAWGRVVETLDSKLPHSKDDTRVLPLTAARTADVIKAVSALREHGAGIASPGTTAIGVAKGSDSSDRRLISMLFQQREDDPNRPQEAEGQQPGEQPEEGRPQPTLAEPQASAGELIGPVQIEFLDGIDAIVVKGNPKDVANVMQIIQSIQELSKQTQPKIEIYPLKYVNGQQLSTLVQSIYDQTLAVRTGRVNITPLVKPNSLLLIGRDEAVAAVIELIQKLDKPISPTSVFQVFPLKNASAQAAAVTVTNFFSGTGTAIPGLASSGLTSSVSVVADYRTNSLIVQASPRELKQVEALLQRIDSDSSPAVNEIRIFPLKNSVADELAPVLQSAITGQAAPNRGAAGQQGAVPGGAQQTGGFGAAGVAGGAAAQANAAGGAQNQQALQQRAASVQLQTLDANRQWTTLRSGILTNVTISSNSRANTLIVNAPRDSMGLIEALIQQLDQIPSAVSQIKVFNIVNGDVSAMISMLQSLFGATQTNRAGGGAFGGFGGGAQFGLGATAEGESILVPIKFSADLRTNSIIASGSAQDLLVVEAILSKLDASDVRSRKNMIYRLKNVYAPQVATSLTQFLTQVQALQQQFAQQGIGSAFEQIEREVVVVAEPTSNSLIVSATPRYFDEIERIIEQIDRRPPMVMIQVLIAEVTLDNTDEFGVELGLQSNVLFDRSLVGSPTNVFRTVTSTLPNGTQTSTQILEGASNVPGFIFNDTLNTLGNSGSDTALAHASQVGGQGISNFGLLRQNSNLGYGGLVLSASSEGVSALLRALSECHRVDVLSRPQIMTLDNQPAFLQVGQQVPRITQSNITVTGTTNVTTLDNVGIILYVQPRVTPENLIVMSVDAEKSEVGDPNTGIPISISTTGQVLRSPVYNTQLAQTIVQATEGQTIVLGGLITTNKTQFHRRVPYLSNLPLLGSLFRFDSVSQERRELLILLTPHIVRDENDADRIKQIEAARMSWCLGDVIKVHGPSGLRTRFDDFSNAETNVVYPGMQFGTPTPAGPELPSHPKEEVPAPLPKGPVPTADQLQAATKNRGSS